MIRRPGAILALLTGLNLLNYLDRLVLSAVLPKVQLPLEKGGLGLSNVEGGFLATVFLLGYFITSPIFGLLGDRFPRKGLITVGVIVWSLATIASGFATGLGTLILARVMVGVGEASYATLAPTIIDDITPAEKKGRSLSIFYMATPIGAALGYLVGGFVDKHWGWRSAFLVAGGPGIVIALTCLLIQEPTRKLVTDKPNILRDIGKLYAIPLYRKGVFGFCAYTAAIGAFSYWAPKFLFQRYNLDLDVANFRFGVITVVAGAIATVVGGRWGDRSANAADLKLKGSDEKTKNDARVTSLLRICAIGSTIGAPLAVACFLSPSPDLFFGLVFFAILFLFLCTSPINAVVLQSVPNELRASAMALSIFAIHLLGDLWSPPFVGLLADLFPVHIAMMALPVAIAVSAILWWPRRGAAAAADPASSS